MTIDLRDGDWILAGHGAEADYGRVYGRSDRGPMHVAWRVSHRIYPESADNLEGLRRFPSELAAKQAYEKRLRATSHRRTR